MTHDVSDDEIWEGLKGRFAVGERLVSRPAAWRERNTQQMKPARRPTRLRVAGAGSLVGVGAAIILVAVALGPGSARRPQAEPTATATASATTPGPIGAPTLTATDNELSLSVWLDRTSVEPGGKVTVTVSVHNGRSSPVPYVASGDSVAGIMATLSLPLVPVGRSWTGIEAALKTDALGKGTVPGETPDTITRGTYTHYAYYDETLAPGQTVTSTLVWTAELVTGVPAVPGDVQFKISLLGPPPPLPSGALPGMEFPATILELSGDMHVVGQAPAILSKGQAIDAALADPRLAMWLTEQPQTTWSDVNMLLAEPGDTFSGAAGPLWELAVFRENGVPRNFLQAVIDPFTGHVQLDICESPCSR
jgi:hypothetical protein